MTKRLKYEEQRSLLSSEKLLNLIFVHECHLTIYCSKLREVPFNDIFVSIKGFPSLKLHTIINYVNFKINQMLRSNYKNK